VGQALDPENVNVDTFYTNTADRHLLPAQCQGLVGLVPIRASLLRGPTRGWRSPPTASSRLDADTRNGETDIFTAKGTLKP